MTFGERVRQLREMRGLSMTELAEQSGVARQYLYVIALIVSVEQEVLLALQPFSNKTRFVLTGQLHVSQEHPKMDTIFRFTSVQVAATQFIGRPRENRVL